MTHLRHPSPARAVFAGGLLLLAILAILALLALPATAVIQAVISGYTAERDIIDASLLLERERTSRGERLRTRFRCRATAITVTPRSYRRVHD